MSVRFDLARGAFTLLMSLLHLSRCNLIGLNYCALSPSICTPQFCESRWHGRACRNWSASNLSRGVKASTFGSLFYMMLRQPQ